MKIIVNSEEIKSISTNLKNSATFLEEKKGQINTLMEGINEAWKGMDAMKYIEAIRINYIKELESLSECLNDCSDYLAKVPEAYNKIDEQFASQKINV